MTLRDHAKTVALPLGEDLAGLVGELVDEPAPARRALDPSRRARRRGRPHRRPVEGRSPSPARLRSHGSRRCRGQGGRSGYDKAMAEIAACAILLLLARRLDPSTPRRAQGAAA
jgi:hypothetical protein